MRFGIGALALDLSNDSAPGDAAMFMFLCLGKLIFLMFNLRVYDVANSMVAPSRGSRRKNLLDLFQGSTLAGVAPK